MRIERYLKHFSILNRCAGCNRLLILEKCWMFKCLPNTIFIKDGDVICFDCVRSEDEARRLWHSWNPKPKV